MKVNVVQEKIVETEVVVHCNDPEEAKIKELLQLLKNFDKKIPSHDGKKTLLLQPSDILYAEFVSRTVFLYTKDGVYPASVTLAQMENYDGFLRCSKSMAVNLRQLKCLKSELNGRILATLSNGEQILISRHYATALRKALLSK